MATLTEGASPPIDMSLLLNDPGFRCACERLGIPPEVMANLGGHRVIAIGEVIVRQGDEVVAHGYNKIVGQGLRHIINAIGGASGGTFCTLTATNTAPYGITAAGASAIRLGIGTGSTVDGTTTLVNQNGTAPNTVSQTYDTPATSTYRFRLTATWNAGTLPAITVTEIGIFGAVAASLGASGNSINYGMFSRMSSTDGEFTPFTVNTAVPLSVEWRVSITFA